MYEEPGHGRSAVRTQPTPRAGSSAVRAVRAAYLIARREFLAYAGAPGFWISLLTGPLLMALFVFGPLLIGRAEPPRAIAIEAEDPAVASAARAAFAGDQRYVVVTSGAAAADAADWLEGRKTVAVGDRRAPLFALVLVRGAGASLSVDYWSINLTDLDALERVKGALARHMRAAALREAGLGPSQIARLETLTPVTQQFSPRAETAGPVTSRDRAPFVAALALALLLWSALMGVANMLLTGVIEEKTNKILDSVLAAASPLAILTGKLMGVAAVSLTLFLVWGGMGMAALGLAAANPATTAAARLVGAALTPETAGVFLLLFAAGYVLYGALFLGIGALCDTLQEAQSMLGPVFVTLALPLLLLGPALQNPNAPLVAAAAWFPPFAPFILMIRAPLGLEGAGFWGPLALLAASTAVALPAAAALFRAGVVDQVNALAIARRLFARSAPGAPPKK